MPVSSPWAPAAGCRVTPGMPVIAFKASSSSQISCSAPCTCDSGCRGWMPARPGNLAVTSLSRGLYFMVQEPRG